MEPLPSVPRVQLGELSKVPVDPSGLAGTSFSVSQTCGITMTYKIIIAVGSLRRDSLNRKLATAVEKLFSAEFSFHNLNIGDLPLYNQDDDGTPSLQVQNLKREIESANGVILFTPEYNRSIPGVLKNAIDHASRPYGKNSWQGKPTGILGISVGSIGTATAQQHLRNIFAYLDAPTLGQPEVFIHAKDGMFNSDGSVSDQSRQFLQAWVDKYVDWLKKFS